MPWAQGSSREDAGKGCRPGGDEMKAKCLFPYISLPRVVNHIF